MIALLQDRAWRWWLGGAGAGLLQALAFQPGVADLMPGLPAVVQALALAASLVLLQAASRPGQGVWVGWGFGTVWLLGGTGWLYVSLHRFGGLPAWLSGLSVALLCLALAVYLAVASALWVRWRSGHWLRDAGLFGALWLLAEVARALIFTGFPWAASGYALIDSPFDGFAPWLGVYGMGWVFVTLVAALTLAVRRGPSRAWALALGGLVLGVGTQSGGLWVQPAGRPLSVSLLQSNVPQDEKFDVDRQIAVLVWHAEQLMSARGALVMAPETAIPLLPADLPEGYWDGLKAAFQQGDRAALIGVPLGSLEAGYTNSVAGISAATRALDGGIYRYNKHHLVPFGEFIPWGFHWFVRMMNMPLGDFARGPVAAPSFAVRDQHVAPNICYEDLFGEELAVRFTTTVPPTILANVSNLAWFGESVAIRQHLQIARLRSLEFQRPTLRSTNTGATVVIDHRGRVTAALPFNQAGVLEAQVQGMQGLTPFARWAGGWGLWPLVVLAIGLVAVLRRRAGAGAV